MKKSQTSLRFRVIVFILTAGMIAFAFIHSSMPADLSGEESKGVMVILQNILDFFGFSTELTDHIVRKAAHFAEYTAIGMLLVSCAYSFSRTKPYRYYSQIFFAGLAAAVIDETIQLNVAGRSGQITDVLLDFSGVITGAVFMLLFYMIYRKIRKIK